MFGRDAAYAFVWHFFPSHGDRFFHSRFFRFDWQSVNKYHLIEENLIAQAKLKCKFRLKAPVFSDYLNAVKIIFVFFVLRIVKFVSWNLSLRRHVVYALQRRGNNWLQPNADQKKWPKKKNCWRFSSPENQSCIEQASYRKPKGWDWLQKLMHERNEG